MTRGRVLVTGAAGFVGSHLCDRLIADGFEVVGVDNLLTGREANLDEARRSSAFRLVLADVSEPLELDGPLDWIAHLASPASPRAYARHPLETMRANAEGTRELLDLAHRTGARFLLASSSEVYGDAAVHPQPETYEGRVDPTGPRSVYQEAKRYSEALTIAAARTLGIAVRIARIFNAYGPRMAMDDGRLVPTLVAQALRDVPLTVHGDGHQTRSLQHIDDLVNGLRRLMDADVPGPVNLGTTEEHTVLDVAALILRLTDSDAPIQLVPGPDVGAQRRSPDVTLALERLGWRAGISLEDGLRATIPAFRRELDSAHAMVRPVVPAQAGVPPRAG